MTYNQYSQWYTDTYGWKDGSHWIYTNLWDEMNGNLSQKWLNQIWEYAREKYGDDLAGMQEYLGKVGGFTWNPEWQDWLQNAINNVNVQGERDFEQQMRDTDLLSTANQLAQLGLNTGSVVSMGRGQMPSVNIPGAASTGSSRYDKEFDRKNSMLKRVFSILGGMASAGIGGAAYGTARRTAGQLAHNTLKSAQRAFAKGDVPSPEMFHGHPVSENDWDDILKEISMQ